MKIISLFIQKAEEKGCATNSILIDYAELAVLDISKDLDDLLLTLESHRFLKVTPFIGGGSSYQLSFIAYINSNLIQSIFSESITYAELFKMVVNYIYEHYRKDDILVTSRLAEELSLDSFLLNPILYHLDRIGVIQMSKTSGNPDAITAQDRKSVV